MEIEPNVFNSDNSVIFSFGVVPVPFNARTLKELTDLHPHMVAGDPGPPERVIYEQVHGLGGERRIPLETVFPPVTVTDEAQLEKLGITRWRIDLTRYRAEDLATGELNRSKGHVNTNRAVEVFQVVSNRIRMLLQNPKDLSKAYLIDAGRGDCVLVPPAWYHSTHVLEGPADVINIVNREGFTDWSEKGYGLFQAAYTFARGQNGEPISVANPSYSQTPDLIELRPTRLPLLEDFSGSIFNLVHQAEPPLLEAFADDILSANPNSHRILPQQTADGTVIQDYYQPVYNGLDNLIRGDELHVLGLEAPMVSSKPMTYLEALGYLLKFSDKEKLLLIDLPEQLGKRLAKDSVREWVQLIQRRLSLVTTETPQLGPDALWQQGYKILKSFETSGSSTRAFLAIDPHDRLSVVKYSDHDGIDGNGIPWLRKQAARMEEYRFYLGHNIPAVFDHTELVAEGDRNPAFFYSMEYRPFEALSDYLLYDPTANGQEFFSRLDVALRNQVRMLYDQPETWVVADQQGEDSYLQKFYIDRFRRRLTLLSDPGANLNSDWIEGGSPVNHVAPMFTRLMSADTLIINGVTYPNLPKLLELLDIHKDQVNQIGPKQLGLAHGDGHIGNIGFEIGKSIEEGFVLFDLRGVDASTRIDIGYDTGKLAFSFLHALVDRAHALKVPASSIEVNEEIKEANVRLEFDASQTDRILLHLELRKQLWGFLQNHQPLVDVFRKMGEESETWLTRTQLGEAIQMLGPAPDRLKDDPSGGISLTYYVLTTLLLHDFLRSNSFDIESSHPLGLDSEKIDFFRFL